MERSYSQPDQAFSYNTLSHMNPRTYRNHAWAQLAKSDTFYVRGSPEERRLQRALGLDTDGEAEDNGQDLEAPGGTTLLLRKGYLMPSLTHVLMTDLKRPPASCTACSALLYALFDITLVGCSPPMLLHKYITRR